MAIALVVSFLIALAHPGDKVTQERIEDDATPAPESVAD